VGIARGVENHGVVDHPAVPRGLHVDAGLSQLAGICLALVAEYFGLTVDDKRGGQPAEVLEVRLSAGDGWVQDPAVCA